MRLILTDLDGTFLNNEGDFNHAYFKQVKQRLHEKEIAFGVVTGKQVARVEELFHGLLDNIWILGDSASHIKYNNEIMFESLLKNTYGLELIDRIMKIHSDQTIIACTSSTCYILNDRTIIEKQGVYSSYSAVTEISNFNKIKEDFLKITVFDVKGRAFDTILKLNDLRGKFYMVASDSYWMDFTNYDVHKGATVKRLQHILGISKSETISFGDGYNDLEMFHESGKSYAMSNAFKEVKKQADEVVLSNDNDGVLKKIEELLL